jgi:hypothetical protein
VSRGETSLPILRPAGEIYDFLVQWQFDAWIHTYRWLDHIIGGWNVTRSRRLVHELQDLRWDKPAWETLFSQQSTREGLRYQSELTVTELRPDELVRWETVAEVELFSAHWQVRLELLSPTQTMVRFNVNLTSSEACRLELIGALQRWAYPLDVIQRQADRSMHNLRAILEGRASEPAELHGAPSLTIPE